MTPWELRGYLTYPNHYGKPRAGTEPEIHFAKGWSKAQAEDLLQRKSEYHLSLEQDAMYGRSAWSDEYKF
jgi:hypothetical protein